MSKIINANKPKSDEEKEIIKIIENTIDDFLKKESEDNGRL